MRSSCDALHGIIVNTVKTRTDSDIALSNINLHLEVLHERITLQNNTNILNKYEPDYLIEVEWRIYASVALPALVQIMACRLDGAKPLSEPMLEYC